MHDATLKLGTRRRAARPDGGTTGAITAYVDRPSIADADRDATAVVL